MWWTAKVKSSRFVRSDRVTLLVGSSLVSRMVWEKVKRHKSSSVVCARWLCALLAKNTFFFIWFYTHNFFSYIRVQCIASLRISLFFSSFPFMRDVAVHVHVHCPSWKNDNKKIHLSSRRNADSWLVASEHLKWEHHNQELGRARRKWKWK